MWHAANEIHKAKVVSGLFVRLAIPPYLSVHYEWIASLLAVAVDIGFSWLSLTDLM